MIDIYCKIDRRHSLGFIRPEDTAEQRRFAAMAAAGMDYAVMHEIKAATDAMLGKLAAHRAARRDSY